MWADSGKLLVLSKLLPLWYTEGHKVLIFSQTRGMLSVIESMVRELGFLYLRMDGSTPVGKRAGLVNRFNTEKNIFVMLLTTRTGLYPPFFSLYSCCLRAMHSSTFLLSQFTCPPDVLFLYSYFILLANASHQSRWSGNFLDGGESCGAV